MEAQTSEYSHTQHAPYFLLLFALAMGFAAIALFVPTPMPVQITFLVTCVVLIFLGACLHHLTVADGGDALLVRFGPLPLLRTSIPYDQIERAEVGRTLLIDGWGLRYSIRGGWVWNIWGRSCVVVHHRGRVTWIGSNDADNLCRFLRSKIASPFQR